MSKNFANKFVVYMSIYPKAISVQKVLFKNEKKEYIQWLYVSYIDMRLWWSIYCIYGNKTLGSFHNWYDTKSWF